MTWEELVEKAKELGYKLKNDKVSDFLQRDDIIKFYRDGYIYLMYSECVYHEEYCCFANKRNPTQMYQIMLALED